MGSSPVGLPNKKNILASLVIRFRAGKACVDFGDWTSNAKATKLLLNSVEQNWKTRSAFNMNLSMRSCSFKPKLSGVVGSIGLPTSIGIMYGSWSNLEGSLIYIHFREHL